MRVALLVTIVSLGGCATQKDWYAVGGSRADGTVKLAYNTNEFEAAQVNAAQGVALAAQRCRAWGYQSAEPFGGVIRQCDGTPGMFQRCGAWTVYAEYQCLTQSTVPATIPTTPTFPETTEQQPPTAGAPAARQSVSQGYAPKKPESPENEYAAGKLARTLGCGVPTLLAMSASTETFQTACAGGQHKIILCEFTNCRVMQ